MIYPKPLLALWLLKKVGRSIGVDQLQHHFGLRWSINSLNFLMTWGAGAIIIWAIIGSRNIWSTGLISVVVGSLAYGALVAATEQRKVRPPDN